VKTATIGIRTLADYSVGLKDHQQSAASLTNVIDPPPPDPPGHIVIDATAFGSVYDAVAGSGACCPNSGGLPIVDLSLQ
jgi:hypothetical protein